MLRLLLLSLFAIPLFLTAQQPVGDDLIEARHLEAILNDSQQLVLHTPTQPDHIFNLSETMPLRTRDIAEGRWLLLSFRARTDSSSLETGEAKLQWVLRQSDRHQETLARTLSVGNEWRTYHFPLRTTRSIHARDLQLNVNYGYPPQRVVLSDVALTLYPESVEESELPRTRISYPGREQDAAWRAAAADRIERHRKGDFTLAVRDGDGNPLPDAEVNVSLERHHFGWGAAVRARELLRYPEHLDRVADAFNLVVFENDLKIKHWNKEGNAERTLKAIDLVKDRDLEVKGHVLIWPGFNHLPPEFRKMEGRPEAVRSAMDGHVRDILAVFGDRVDRWDVVNETYTNRDLQRITGSEAVIEHGFTYLREHFPQARRFTNEYGIISRGGHNGKKQHWYRDFVVRIDSATGGLVDGIGLQSHMGSDLTPPERVIELLDFYAATGKTISISEFTLDIDDDPLREDYTRDYLTAAFSHPAVSEFLFWGYYAPTHPKASIFQADWTPGPMGRAYFDLVHDTWTTELQLTTDDRGEVRGRGFYGRYTYTVDHKGQQYSGTFSVLPLNDEPTGDEVKIISIEARK